MIKAHISKSTYWWAAVLLGSIAWFMFMMFAKYQVDPRLGTNDFIVFYAAATLGFDHQPLYHNNALFEYINALRGGSDGAMRYLYAPAVLFLFFPLTLLPYPAAVWTWFGLNCVVLGVLIVAIQRLAGQPFTLREWALAAALSVLFRPVYTNFWYGQINIVLAVLLVAHLYCVRKQRLVAAGVWLAFPIIAKIYPIIFLGYYAVRKQWRVIATTMLVSAAFFALSIGLFGWTNFIQYAQRVPSQITYGIQPSGTTRYENATLNGYIYRLLVVSKRQPLDLVEFLERTSGVVVKEKNERRFGYYHLAIVLPLAGLLAWLFLKAKRTADALVWEAAIILSFVFFAAKDIHVEYTIMLLPFYILFLVLPGRGLGASRAMKALLIISFILISLATVTPLPFMTVPPLIIVPAGLMGITAFLAALLFGYYHQFVLGSRR